MYANARSAPFIEEACENIKQEGVAAEFNEHEPQIDRHDPVAAGHCAAALRRRAAPPLTKRP